MKNTLLLLLLICLSSIVLAGTHGKVSFVAFGDSGYHYDYLKRSVIDKPITHSEFSKDKYESWLEKFLPISEFREPPIYTLPGSEHVVEASGAQPVADAMEKFCKNYLCQFAIMLGDNIYPKGATNKKDHIRFQKIFEQPYQGLVKSHIDFKLYAALGNHDWKTSRIGRNRQVEYGKRIDTAFTMKDPGFYKYTKGDVDFFVIDSNLLLAGTVVMENELNPDGSEKSTDDIDVPKPWELQNKEDKKQLKWLKRSLKKSKAKWKIVYGHHVLWSAGGQKFEQARSLRELISPIVCRYADIYIAGHEHDLEVNLDTCQKEIGIGKPALPLVVSGAGSRQRPVHHHFQIFQQVKYPQYKALWSKGMTWGYSHFEIIDDVMTIRMVTTSNQGKGDAIIEKTFTFKNRSSKI